MQGNMHNSVHYEIIYNSKCFKTIKYPSWWINVLWYIHKIIYIQENSICPINKMNVVIKNTYQVGANVIAGQVVNFKSLRLGSSLLIKIGPITINTFLSMRNVHLFLQCKKSMLRDLTNSQNAFCASCWLQKCFAYKKWRCLKKWQSVGKMSGEYGG